MHDFQKYIKNVTAVSNISIVRIVVVLSIVSNERNVSVCLA